MSDKTEEEKEKIEEAENTDETGKTEKTKILVVVTGGTLNMKIKKNEKELSPAAKTDLIKWLQNHGILQMEDTDPYTLTGKEIVCAFESTKKLIDSSEIEIDDWNEIANLIQKNYKKYDGFVVIHGTDTMVYTASALSFIFDNLQKSVVITGAQRPIYDIGSDGENNFKSAVYFAAFATGRIAEVVICFNNKIFRGNRTAKKDCVKYDAYESPNYPVLATVDNEGRIEVTVRSNQCRQPKGGNLKLKSLSKEVCLLKLYPGITPKIVKGLMGDCKGIVLETYGAGNAPRNLAREFKDNKANGTVVVNVTQCLRGGVTMLYETGKALQDVGVIPCGDMTTSAAFTKLCYLLGEGREDIAKEMKQDLKGEITETDIPKEMKQNLKGKSTDIS